MTFSNLMFFYLFIELIFCICFHIIKNVICFYYSKRGLHNQNTLANIFADIVFMYKNAGFTIAANPCFFIKSNEAIFVDFRLIV